MTKWWKYIEITKPPSAKFWSRIQPAKKKNDESHIPACLLRRFAIGEQLAPSEQHLQKNMGHFLSIPRGSKPIIIVRFWSFCRFSTATSFGCQLEKIIPREMYNELQKVYFLRENTFGSIISFGWSQCLLCLPGLNKDGHHVYLKPSEIVEIFALPLFFTCRRLCRLFLSCSSKVRSGSSSV